MNKRHVIETRRTEVTERLVLNDDPHEAGSFQNKNSMTLLALSEDTSE